MGRQCQLLTIAQVTIVKLPYQIECAMGCFSRIIHLWYIQPAGVASDTVCLALRNLSNAFSLILELRFGMSL